MKDTKKQNAERISAAAPAPAQPTPPADRISKAVEAASPSATTPTFCNCKTSTGICGSITRGTGQLDFNGYWERPCPHGNAFEAEAQSSRSEAQPTDQPDESVLRQLARDAAERLCVLAKPKGAELPEWPGTFYIENEIVKVAKEWAGRSASVPSENLAPYKELLRKICEILQSCDLESSYVIDARRNGRTAKIKQELCDWLTEAASRVPALDHEHDFIPPPNDDEQQCDANCRFRQHYCSICGRNREQIKAEKSPEGSPTPETLPITAKSWAEFDAWWREDGKFFDPDTDDVPWFDKRQELAEYAWHRARQAEAAPQLDRKSWERGRDDALKIVGEYFLPPNCNAWSRIKALEFPSPAPVAPQESEEKK